MSEIKEELRVEIGICPKCGSEMKSYQIQIQPRAGYPTDIEIQAFQCTNPRCRHKENKRREVSLTNPLIIEEEDGSRREIR